MTCSRCTLLAELRDAVVAERDARGRMIRGSGGGYIARSMELRAAIDHVTAVLHRVEVETVLERLEVGT